MRPRVDGEETIFGKTETYAVWEAAQELGIAVNLLMNSEHIPALADIAERYPQVPLLIDHMAHPDVSAGRDAAEFKTLLALSKFNHVSVKVTGYYYHSNESWPYSDCHDIFKPECVRAESTTFDTDSVQGARSTGSTGFTG